MASRTISAAQKLAEPGSWGEGGDEEESGEHAWWRMDMGWSGERAVGGYAMCAVGACL